MRPRVTVQSAPLNISVPVYTSYKGYKNYKLGGQSTVILGIHQAENSSSNPNAIKSIMQIINDTYPNNSWIQGHLLNEELGGTGLLVENLVPLTSKANADHKNNVESKIKNFLTLTKNQQEFGR